jgi:hypothetical protein
MKLLTVTFMLAVGVKLYQSPALATVADPEQVGAGAVPVTAGAACWPRPMGRAVAQVSWAWLSKGESKASGVRQRRMRMGRFGGVKERERPGTIAPECAVY